MNLKNEILNIASKHPIEGSWKLEGFRDNQTIYRNLFGTVVVSSVDLPEGKPEWHLSISHLGKRPSPEIAAAALKQFDCRDFEEDNHIPGIARHFWLAVDKNERKVCPCKDEEKPIIEGDFIWREDGKA